MIPEAPLSPEPPSPRRRAPLLRGLALSVAALAVGGFAVLAATERPKQPAPPAPAAAAPRLLLPAEVRQVVPEDLVETLAISGAVTPLRRVTLSAEVGGVIAEAGPLPGEDLAEGALLATISPEDHALALTAEEAALAALRAEAGVARDTRDRAQRLTASGAATRAALVEAEGALGVLEANIAAAEARVALARRDLDRARVAMPFAGTLAGRSVEPGQLVAAGTALFEVVDLSQVVVEAAVPLAQAARLHPGQAAVMASPEDPARRIAAKVVRIAPQAVEGSRAVQVWLQIDNADRALRAGTFLTGTVELDRAEGALALPQAAVRTGADGRGEVLAIRDGQAVLVPVTLGETWPGGRVEVTSGLTPRDRVVVLPLTGLAPGDAVALAEE